jgi:hypothetical protein
VVRRARREEGVELEPFKALAPEIKKELLDAKRQAAMERWIDSLRNKAEVTINRENLKAIRLEQP